MNRVGRPPAVTKSWFVLQHLEHANGRSANLDRNGQAMSDAVALSHHADAAEGPHPRNESGSQQPRPLGENYRDLHATSTRRQRVRQRIDAESTLFSNTEGRVLDVDGLPSATSKTSSSWADVTGPTHTTWFSECSMVWWRTRRGRVARRRCVKRPRSVSRWLFARGPACGRTLTPCRCLRVRRACPWPVR